MNFTKKLYKQAQSILTAVFSPFTIADKSNECFEYTSNLNLIFFTFKNKFNSRVSILETIKKVDRLNRNNVLFQYQK